MKSGGTMGIHSDAIFVQWLVFEWRVDRARVAAQLVGADGDCHFSLNVR